MYGRPNGKLVTNRFILNNKQRRFYLGLKRQKTSSTCTEALNQPKVILENSW